MKKDTVEIPRERCIGKQSISGLVLTEQESAKIQAVNKVAFKYKSPSYAVSCIFDANRQIYIVNLESHDK